MHVKMITVHRQLFQVFTIAPRLNHLGYWLAGRDRHLLSLLKAEPFKILTMVCLCDPTSRVFNMGDPLLSSLFDAHSTHTHNNF